MNDSKKTVYYGAAAVVVLFFALAMVFYFKPLGVEVREKSNLPSALSSRLKARACEYYSSHRKLECFVYTTIDGYRLPIAIFRGKKDSVPLLYLGGGPGLWGNTEEVSLQSWEYWLMNTRVAGDLILFDYRALNDEGFVCDAYQQISKHLDAFELEPQAAYQNTRSILQGCLQDLRTALAAKDQSLQAFNSFTNARDGHNLMLEQGYDQWDILAASYGTRVALIMANVHKNRVRRMILDGVYPPGAGDMIEARRSWVQAFENYWRWCEQDEECSKVLQNPQKLFWSVMEQLAQKPLAITTLDWQQDQMQEWMLGETYFAGAIYAAFYSNELRKHIPYFIRSVANRSVALDSLITEFFYNNVFDSNFNAFMFTVTECNDNALTAKQDFESYLNDVPRWRNVMQHDWEWSACQNLGFTPVSFPVLKELSMPTILVSGEFDPVTPIDYVWQVLPVFSEAWVAEAAGMGHAEFTQSECAAGLIREFFNQSPPQAVEQFNNQQACHHGFNLAEK